MIDVRFTDFNFCSNNNDISCSSKPWGTHQSFLGFDERPIDAVHLVVEAAGIAQVMAGSVASPQRS